MKETAAPSASELGTLPEGVGVAVGASAPTATVHDAEGRTVQLADLYARGPILLVFYRGGWCPFCNFQIRELSKAVPALEKRGVTPVAISVDTVGEAAKTRTAHGLGFPVLSDPELGAHKAFRVLNVVDDATLERLEGYGIDLEKRSGQAHHTIAVPSIFVVADGKVRFAHADHDYKRRPSMEQLFGVLDELGYTPKGSEG